MSKRVIYKYPLAIVGRQSVEMPRGAEILCVQEQFGMAKVWASVDPASPPELREFHMVGTGHPFPSDDQPPYLATVQIGVYVWHFFAHRTGGQP
jgi:hypothetical protein